MRDYLEPMLGTTGATIAQFAITLVVIAVVILIVFWLIRIFTGGVGTSTIRGRQPRLGLLDALPIDQKRRLVLVRRDNVEHLILIGGATDIVVEGAIQRPSAAQRRAEAMARSHQPRRGDLDETAETAEPLAAPRDEIPAVAPIVEAAPVYEPVPELPAEPVRAEESRHHETRAPEPRAQEDWVPPVRVERSREARASDPIPADRRSADIRPPVIAERRVAERQVFERQVVEQQEIERTVEPEAEPRVIEAEPVIEVAAVPEAVEIAPPPVQEPPARGRSFGSFFTSSRSRPVAEPEPRRPEPPRRPLSRATPVAPPRDVDPVAEEDAGVEAVRVEPQMDEPATVEPVRVEPVRAELPRSERIRSSTPRPSVPPAPPVAPPTLGEAPYGAPIADPDQPLRFEPIFDVDPASQTEPVRPVRHSREPMTRETLAREPFVAPNVEIGRDEDDRAPEAAESDGHQKAVGDLEKEMARLLGEISNTRRS